MHQQPSPYLPGYGKLRQGGRFYGAGLLHYAGNPGNSPAARYIGGKNPPVGIMLPVGLKAPHPAGWAFFLEVFCGSGPPRPTPGPFSFTSERKGGKEAPQGASRPFAPPVGLLAQKADRLQTVPLTKSGCPCSKSVLFSIGRTYVQGHGTKYTFLRKAKPSPRCGRASRCAML